MNGGLFTYFLIVIASLGNVLGGSFLRLGMQKVGLESLNPGYLFKNLLSVVFQPLTFAGFVFFGISTIIWLRVLTTEPLSRVYPILTGLIVLFLVISSTFLLREPLTLTRISGMALIIFGTFLVFAKA